MGTACDAREVVGCMPRNFYGLAQMQENDVHAVWEASDVINR